MLKRLILFLIVNFSVLSIGSFYTRDGVSSIWYQNLNKAPWTPPGWVFGFAWTLIMICFSFYMAYLYGEVKSPKERKQIIILYIVQCILNGLWNPTFFGFHQTELALFVLFLLTILLRVFFYKYWSLLERKTFLLLPYSIWLWVAISLNAYVVLKN